MLKVITTLYSRQFEIIVLNVVPVRNTFPKRKIVDTLIIDHVWCIMCGPSLKPNCMIVIE